jgi:dTDP-4-amino-4,6-dideoxygalactose transaminase
MIRLAKSTISKAEINAVIGVLKKEYLGMGQEVATFEQMITEFIGRPAVCVANGTAAIHLACQAAGIGDGDEVLVQSLTFVASFQAISATGAKPIPCEVESGSLTIDLKDAEKRLTKRTKAIMPMHYSGGVGNIDEIYEFAKKNNLRIIEDAAHAFGTVHNNKKVGSFGDIVCFSFDGIKNITSGEGGCIVTSDNTILRKIKDARLLGVEGDTEKRYNGNRSWDFEVTMQGWRYHMSNIMAAIGIVQLQRFNQIATKRKELAILYSDALIKNPLISIFYHNYSNVVPHLYVVRIHGLRDCNQIRERLLKEYGIQTGFHYKPNHLLEYYFDNDALPLPLTEKISSELISLPLHVDLSTKDIEYIVSSLNKVL